MSRQMFYEPQADDLGMLTDMADAIREPRWECPFCGQERFSPNGTGGDIACCGEVGHAIPMEDE